MTVTPAPPPGLIAFARANAPWLAAGALLTFASSFGQTFFISLFAGEIRAAFDLTHGDWGLIYTAGTLCSAAAMLWAGGLTDRFRSRALGVVLLGGIAAACLFAAAAPHWAWLIPAVFLLRFFGQGMLHHTAIVSMGRWFARTRGRAVAVASMGMAMGEAVLPVAFVALIATVGWRGGWVAAAVCALLLIPILPRLLRTERTPGDWAAEGGATGMDGRHWTRGEALGHWLFWTTLPAFLAQPVFSTAFFFHQVHLAEVKGWTMIQFASLYPLYVVAAIAMNFVGGWLVDRFGAARCAWGWQALLAAGLVVVGGFDGLPAAAAGFLLLGSMQGFGSAISGSWWPELYGSRHLGSIRAVASSTMVFATALGPGVTGALIDAGVGFEAQLVGMAVYATGACALFAWAGLRAARAG